MSTKPTTTDLEWTELDQRAVDTARVLAADAVQKVGNGHPGTAMSLAPAAYTLFQKVMRHDPADPQWVGPRPLRAVRRSLVPDPLHPALPGRLRPGAGRPEVLPHLGLEDPGPPGVRAHQGRRDHHRPAGPGCGQRGGHGDGRPFERGLFDPEAPEGTSPFDHYIYSIAGDGCLQEGISAEASSLAGHQQLGNLVLLWDDNHISIEGDTETAVSEDTVKRYEAYGWHVQRVEPKADGDLDPAAIYAAIEKAKAVTDRPSFIAMRSIIAWPAPNAQNTEAAHGSALGDEEVAATKRVLGFDPAQSFAVSDEVLEHTRGALERGRQAKAEWEKGFQAGARTTRTAPPSSTASARARCPPAGRRRSRSSRPARAWPPVPPPARSSRRWARSSPSCGAAPPTSPGSNNTTIDKNSSFLPAGNPLPEANPYGRTIHFGIREFAMAAEMNGITLPGNTRVYGGTFLVFSDYMRNAVRLSALMHLPVTYVWTHDSIGLGEDGPTHQPVEHLAALRAIPGLNVVRPADANETAIAWREVLKRWTKEFGKGAPTGLVLTRQGVPAYEPNEDAARGGYVLFEAEGGEPRSS